MLSNCLRHDLAFCPTHGVCPAVCMCPRTPETLRAIERYEATARKVPA